MSSQLSILPSVLNEFEEKWPSSLEHSSWYLVAASALVNCSDPMNLGQLYVHLTSQQDYNTPEERRALNKRLREFVIKQLITVGAPKAAVAFFGLIKVEQPGDADMSFTKSHIALDAANHERGTEFLRKVYGTQRMDAMVKAWGPDFEWLTKDVVYGIFHADDSVLGNLEAELIMYTAIVCQGLRVPAENQLEGLHRMGLTVGEIQGVTACAELVARWAGHDMQGWPNVHEIAELLALE